MLSFCCHFKKNSPERWIPGNLPVFPGKGQNSSCGLLPINQLDSKIDEVVFFS